MAVEAEIQYLKRDKLYEVEKPYNVEFEPQHSTEIKRSNLIPASSTVFIQAVQPAGSFDLNKNGFCIIDKEIPLDAELALQNPDAVEAAYLEELENTLSRSFPEYRRIEPLEFLIRSRDKRFPSDDKMFADYEQPARLAHSDYTPIGAFLQLKSSFPGQEQYFQDKEYDMINVWRPLVGPNNDWPLALCDYTSIDADNDITVGDTIHPDGTSENQLLHANTRHRWYYVEGQRTSDLLVFRNTDSTGQRAKAFHAAFDNPRNRGPPRVSCEARFVAFREPTGSNGGQHGPKKP